MSQEKELQDEVERLTKRLEELEASQSGSTLPSSLSVVHANIPKAKPDNYSDGPWNEWVSHFKLCADINQWNNTQRCQQLAVSLRGRAQRIFLSLNEEEKASFEDLEKALQSRIQPDQQRKIHKLSFGSRRRMKGEGIIDLATSLRQLAALAYTNRDPGFIEEELVDQFLKALDTKELRVGVSQADPKSLDEAVKLALKLESIHITEAQQSPTKVNMASAEDTAESCMAGASKQHADTAPKWAQRLVEQQCQQTDLLQEMTKCMTEKSTRRPRNRSIQCYACGKQGHIARECRYNGNYQGNANRAGVPPSR